MPDYITEAEADTFLTSVFDTPGWDAITVEAIRDLALKSATESIDNLLFKGKKTVTGQANEFPRTIIIEDLTDGGTSLVDIGTPDAIKNACAYITDALLGGRSTESSFAELSITAESMPGFSREMRDAQQNLHIAHGIPSIRAWNLLKPYLGSPSKIILQRTR